MYFSFIVIMMPWVIRNYLLSGYFVPTTTLVGSFAHEGLFASKNGPIKGDFSNIGKMASKQRAEMAEKLGLQFKDAWHKHFYNVRDEVAFNKSIFSEVVREYINQPTLFLKTIFNNSWRFWFQGMTEIANRLNLIFMIPFLTIFIFGIFFAIKQKIDIFPALLLIIYYYSIHLPLQGLTRYHVPIIPLMTIISTIALFNFLKKFGIQLPLIEKNND